MSYTGTAPAFAVGTLTSDTTIPTADDTVTVGGKTYTYKASVTTVDGEVKLGASAAAALQNLYYAINLGTGSGSLYGSSTAANTHVKAISVDATTLVVSALTPGAVGNLIGSTEASTHLSWGGATLASGTGNINAFITAVIAGTELNSEALVALKKLTIADD